MTSTIFESGVEIIVDEEVDQTNEVEKNKLRHVINPTANLHIWRIWMTSQDVVDIARVNGYEIVALCGTKFVPTQNPEDVKETCNACLDIVAIMLSNPPEND